MKFSTQVHRATSDGYHLSLLSSFWKTPLLGAGVLFSCLKKLGGKTLQMTVNQEKIFRSVAVKKNPAIELPSATLERHYAT